MCPRLDDGNARRADVRGEGDDPFGRCTQVLAPGEQRVEVGSLTGRESRHRRFEDGVEH